MELLLRLTGGELTEALKLQAERDYELKTLLDYNPRLHRVQSSDGYKGRQLFSKSGFGALLFVRRLKDGQPVDDPADPEGA
jgi:hypothetical protein